MLGVVADLDADARVLELCGRVGFLDIAAADLVAPREKDARQGGDARAADAHEVNLHFRAT